jgi:Rv2632c-like
MTGNDDRTKTCQIDVLIEEHEERTRAKARLSWAGQTHVGVGLARLDPADEPVAQIGDELAIARALSDLANQLFALTSSDIQASTDESVTGLHH